MLQVMFLVKVHVLLIEIDKILEKYKQSHILDFNAFFKSFSLTILVEIFIYRKCISWLFVTSSLHIIQINFEYLGCTISRNILMNGFYTFSVVSTKAFFWLLNCNELCQTIVLRSSGLIILKERMFVIPYYKLINLK